MATVRETSDKPYRDRKVCVPVRNINMQPIHIPHYDYHEKIDLSLLSTSLCDRPARHIVLAYLAVKTISL